MKPEVKRMISFIAIVLGFFMALLDATIVNIALPEMAKHYKESVGNISWVVNGYNLAFAVFILTAARLADQFGRKKLFLVGIALFTLTSALCGLARSIHILIALRVLQGLAGAIVVPVTIPLAADMFPKEMHGLIIGAWGAISGLAAASGPTLGGVLTNNFQWQSIFFVNLPIGIVTFVMAWLLLRESVDPTAGRQIDWVGVASVSIAMFCVTYALIKTTDFGWSSPKTVALFVASAAFFVLFVLVEFRGKHPMLPMWLLRLGEFDCAAISMFIIGGGIMNSTFLMSFFLTQIREMTVLQAGVTISLMPLASMLASASAGPLSNRLGSRWFAVAGMFMMAGAVYLFSGLGVDSTQLDVIWRLSIMGFGLGMAMAPIMASSVRNVPEEKIGISSGVTNMARSLGTVLGVALIVTVLNGHISEEVRTAKAQSISMVSRDQVLDSRLKTGLIDKIKTMKLSQSSEIMTEDEVLLQLKREEKKILVEMTPIQQLLAKAVFIKQEREVTKLYPRLKDEFKRHAASAFDTTFRFFSLILLIGLPFAFFCDKGRSRDGMRRELNETPRLYSRSDQS